MTVPVSELAVALARVEVVDRLREEGGRPLRGRREMSPNVGRPRPRHDGTDAGPAEWTTKLLALCSLATLRRVQPLLRELPLFGDVGRLTSSWASLLPLLPTAGRRLPRE